MTSDMSREQMAEKLCDLAAEQAGVNRAEVNLDTHFVQDLNFDSLDMVDYIMSVEDAFHVNIPDDVADKVKTVRQALDALQSDQVQPAKCN